MRALDRVVSVTSTADVFPFPMQSGAATAQPNGTLNGAQATFSLSDDALGSDEALGGALLTPIPWLNNASPPDPEGTGIDEGTISPCIFMFSTLTISLSCAVSIVTTSPTLHNQLLSQPADLTPQEHVGTGGSVLERETPAESTEEVPHARGPSVLGVEDLGLQDGKGVEMTLQGKETEADAHSSTAESSTLRGSTHESVTGAGTTESATQGQKDEDAKPDAVAITAATADGDGDITLSDEPHISQKGQDEKK